MQYAYEKLMRDNDLTFSELPNDAKTVIRTLLKSVKATELTEQRGHSVKQETLDQIKVLDKTAVSEIVDYLEEKEEQGSNGNQETKEVDIETAYGDSIEEELKALSSSGNSEFTGEEVRSMAPKSYKEIHKTYEADGINGIKAGKYLLKETGPGTEIFKF